MPLQRGYVHKFIGQSAHGTQALLILTNDRWNATMSQVGVVPIRQTVAPLEVPYAVGTIGGRSAIACALLSLDTPGSGANRPSAIGPAIALLDDAALAAVEDRLRDFLGLPSLLGTPDPHARRPPAGAIDHPLWGDVYRAREPIQGENKRYIVLSPNPWNARAGRVVAVRTTTRFKFPEKSFPQVQSGKARACCGETSSRANQEFLLRPQDRPTPSTTSLPDMTRIARGVAFTHELGASLGRIGISVP